MIRCHARPKLTTLARATRVGLCTCIAVGFGLGCASGEASDRSSGALGRVDFSYRRSCFFGCSIEQPLLAGAPETIDVTGPGDRAGVQVQVADAELLDAEIERQCACVRKDDDNSRVEIENEASCDALHHKVCDNRVLLQAHAAGSTRLTLQSAAGETIDYVEVTIRDADHAAFFVTLPSRLGTREQSELRAKAGDRVQIEVALYDADGRKLLAPDGVRWRVSNPLLAQVSSFLIAPAQEISSGLSINLDALAPGSLTVQVQVPGLSARLPVRIDAR